MAIRAIVAGGFSALILGCALNQDQSSTYIFPDPARDTLGEDGVWRGEREYSGSVEFKYELLNRQEMSCSPVRFSKEFGKMLGNYRPVVLRFEGQCWEPLVPIRVRVYE